jgi:hypothetical protein
MEQPAITSARPPTESSLRPIAAAREHRRSRSLSLGRQRSASTLARRKSRSFETAAAELLVQKALSGREEPSGAVHMHRFGEAPLLVSLARSELPDSVGGAQALEVLHRLGGSVPERVEGLGGQPEILNGEVARLEREAPKPARRRSLVAVGRRRGALGRCGARHRARCAGIGGRPRARAASCRAPCRASEARLPKPSVWYSATIAQGAGSCPIEAGILGRLADHECRHGRLPFDRTAACGCWPQEGAAVVPMPARLAGRPASERAA